jgi:uncharacterized protein YbaP (TraB family)
MVMKNFLAAVIGLCIGSAGLYGETSVWKISGGDNVLYLGGTIHILRESDYPLPEPFDAAFEQSDIIVFETSADDSLALLDKGPVKAFLDECTQIAAMVQENEEIGKVVALWQQLNVLVARHATVYNSILDQTIPLTDDERAIRDEILGMALYLRGAIQREDMKACIAKAQNLLVMLEESDDLRFITGLLNPDYKSLEAILSEETYGVFESLCAAYNYPVVNLKYFRPYIAYSTLLAHVLRRFAQADGVDVFFQKKAREHGKTIAYLETNEFQYHLLANLGSEYGEAYYVYLFHELEASSELDLALEFDEMADAWRRGESGDSLEELSYEQEHFPAVYKAMITDRNNAWLPVIEDYLKTAPVEFVLVGAGHLFGSDGLLAQLEKRGYQIKQQ